MKRFLNWNALLIVIITITFVAILNNLNGAATREAEAAEAVRDTLRMVVLADSVLRVRDQEEFEEALLVADEAATEAREERDVAETRRRLATVQRDSLDSVVDALPDTATMVPRELYERARVAADETGSALLAINQTLVSDTVRLSDLLAEARRGWTGEIESHNLTRGLNEANRNLAELWERAANPGFLSKLWDGKEEFLLGAVVGAVLISSIQK